MVKCQISFGEGQTYCDTLSVPRQGFHTMLGVRQVNSCQICNSIEIWFLYHILFRDSKAGRVWTNLKGFGWWKEETCRVERNGGPGYKRALFIYVFFLQLSLKCKISFGKGHTYWDIYHCLGRGSPPQKCGTM